MNIHQLCTQVAWSRLDLLIEDLACENEFIEIRAIRLLAELKGPQVVGPLAARLQAEYLEEVQVELCRAVAAVGAMAVLPELEALLQRSADENVKAAAAAAIAALTSWQGPVAPQARVEVPPNAADVLLQALRSEQGDDHALAADALGRLGCTDALPDLIAGLRDARSEVRGAAVAALRMIGRPTPAVLRALAGAFADEDMWVKAEAFRAVGKLGYGEDERLRQELMEAFFAAVPGMIAGRPGPWWGTVTPMTKALGTEQDMIRLTRLLMDLPYGNNHSPLAGCVWQMAAPGRFAANELIMTAMRQGVIPWKFARALGVSQDPAAVPLLLECAGPRISIPLVAYGRTSAEMVRRLTRECAPRALAQYPNGQGLLRVVAQEWLAAPEREEAAVKSIAEQLADKALAQRLLAAGA